MTKLEKKAMANNAPIWHLMNFVSLANMLVDRFGPHEQWRKNRRPHDCDDEYRKVLGDFAQRIGAKSWEAVDIMVGFMVQPERPSQSQALYFYFAKAAAFEVGFITYSGVTQIRRATE